MQENIKNKRKTLSKAFSQTLKNLREKTGKSITLISDEINLSKTIWADAENGEVDMQFSTFWRITEALDIPPEDFIKILKTNLPKNFGFFD
jgi:transcriptional regulator with XRE-family HTH domain